MSTQYAMPPYFTWIVDKLIAISAHPYHHTHLNYLTLNKIQTVVSIQDLLQAPFHTNPLLKVVHFPLYYTPNINDCHNFVNLIENAKRRGEVLSFVFFVARLFNSKERLMQLNKGVLIHCVKGEERVAALVGCFLVKLWQCRPDFAINYLRGIDQLR